MKIQTSYFYQVRNFTPNMIPLSTAVGDPLWYHNGTRNKSVRFIDKNGVLNGLRAEPFVPGKCCDGLCHGPEYCAVPNPPNCSFLQAYLGQLNKLNFNDIYQRFERLCDNYFKQTKCDGEPTCVLLVHEAFTRPCSERCIIHQWFQSHNYPITEFGFEHQNLLKK